MHQLKKSPKGVGYLKLQRIFYDQVHGIERSLCTRRTNQKEHDDRCGLDTFLE